LWLDAANNFGAVVRKRGNFSDKAGPEPDSHVWIE
jgi:hypothetical protein